MAPCQRRLRIPGTMFDTVVFHYFDRPSLCYLSISSMLGPEAAPSACGVGALAPRGTRRHPCPAAFPTGYTAGHAALVPIFWIMDGLEAYCFCFVLHLLGSLVDVQPRNIRRSTSYQPRPAWSSRVHQEGNFRHGGSETNEREGEGFR